MLLSEDHRAGRRSRYCRSARAARRALDKEHHFPPPIEGLAASAAYGVALRWSPRRRLDYMALAGSWISRRRDGGTSTV